MPNVQRLAPAVRVRRGRRVTNYLKLSARAPRDLSDADSVRRPPKRSSNGDYTTDWVFAFGPGGLSEALGALKRKRTVLIRKNPDVAPYRYTNSIFKSIESVVVNPIGNLARSHLGVVR